MQTSTLVVLAVITTAELVQLAAIGLLLRHVHRRILTLTRVANADHLTGVVSRRGLHQAVADLTAAGTPPGVLLLDLSLFKEINNGYGHDAGDDLLRVVAGRLDALATSLGGVAGRLGGDEFAVLLPNVTSETQLVDAARLIADAVVEPVLLDGLVEPVTVACVIGLAVPAAQPVAGKPFRAADIALYHARHHRQPYALYQPGMTHPAAEERHGPRLRDQRPAPPIAVFDPAMFARLAAGDVSSDVAHLDDIAELQDLLELLDPASRDFGTDVADLVRRCVEYHALRLRHPVTDVDIHPTTIGESRDGGFLVLVNVADQITLASGQLHPRLFRDGSFKPSVLVLREVAETVCRVYDAFRAAQTTTHRRSR